MIDIFDDFRIFSGHRFRPLARITASLAAVILATLLCQLALAQELAPRAYLPTPVGTKLAIFGYQLSTGDIVTDPSLPLTGVDSRLNTLQAAYQQSFSLFDRSTSVQLSLPYTWGRVEGFVEDEFQRRDLADMSDARLRFAINLHGAPAMDSAGFLEMLANPRTLIGASLTIQPPTGAYAPDRLINTGTNRWAVKPAIGIIWPITPTWYLEGELGAWIFGDNDEFLGTTREQDALTSIEGHLVKVTRSGIWASLDANYYRGGRSVIDGIKRADLQRTSRFGFTAFYPFLKRHAVRASFSTGVVAGTGGDFDLYALSYIYAWK